MNQIVSRNFPRPLLDASSSPLGASSCFADFFAVSFLGAAFAEEDPIVVLSDSLTTSASDFALRPCLDQKNLRRLWALRLRPVFLPSAPTMRLQLL